MYFDEFLERIPKLEKIPLTGVVSHLKLAPLERFNSLINMSIDKQKVRSAAVLSLVYKNENGEASLVLTKRRAYTGIHSNQISFPGGKAEKHDSGLQATAIRETEEEIGIQKNKIELIRQLTDVYIPPSNFLVSPFLGYTNSIPHFIKQDSEVESIIAVRIKDLMSDEYLTRRLIDTSYATKIDVPAFDFDGQIVWGATAMMLSEIKDLLKNTL
ncbi:MAG: coenzyme A pyrophosphatase [Flavobacteriales bacterium CG_4_9_14_3_um_filter_40_17]|nr:MAG: coenzyme A pyrophosphatase [Flavobacteriales bacterium CG_4_9_14_3_um_filter_40_17]